ncbi:MAG: hypothetical protein HYY67_01850 [Thaumarchaeota archaeon]|nr:hypothetical protein [Nitrososphaerota archaeon]
MSRQQRFRNRYSSRSGRPVPTIRITFRPVSSTGFSQPVTEEFDVDTGFHGALKMPSGMTIVFAQEGLKGIQDTWILANGTGATVWKFRVEILRIEGEVEFNFPSPIPSVVGCMGSGGNLIGLELLNRWIAELHGPQRILSIYEET